MARPEASLDRAVTQAGQAWLGGIQAYGRILEKMRMSLHEEAHRERVLVALNSASFEVCGPSPARRLHVTPLLNEKGQNVGPTPVGADDEPEYPPFTVIHPTTVWLSAVDIPPLASGDDVVLVHLQAYPTPDHDPGVYCGGVEDDLGNTIYEVYLDVHPPVKPEPSSSSPKPG